VKQKVSYRGSKRGMKIKDQKSLVFTIYAAVGPVNTGLCTLDFLKVTQNSSSS